MPTIRRSKSTAVWQRFTVICHANNTHSYQTTGYTSEAIPNNFLVRRLYTCKHKSENVQQSLSDGCCIGNTTSVRCPICRAIAARRRRWRARRLSRYLVEVGGALYNLSVVRGSCSRWNNVFNAFFACNIFLE